MTLERKTALKRGGPLKSNPKKTQEWKDRSRQNIKASGDPVKRSTPKKKSAKVKAYEAELDALRPAIAQRSKGMCEARLPKVCEGRAPVDEEGRAINIHHRQPRPVGPNTMENLVHLCGSGTTGCHGWVEHNRPKAKDLGLLVSRHSPAPTTPWTPLRRIA